MTEQEKMIETVVAFSPIERRIDMYGCEIGVSRQWYNEATAILMEINEGKYLKVPEGAVVLTKEECEHKVILDEDHFERALNYEREEARKDTAKAILNVLYFNLQNSVKGHIAKSNDYYNVMGRIQQIAKNYGVEIEE